MITQPTQIVAAAHSIVNHIGRRVVSGDRKITDCIGFFRLFLVGIRYFSVFKILKSVSVSVFKNIGYLFGFSVYRPMSTSVSRPCVLLYILWLFVYIVLLQITMVKIVILISGKRKSGKDYVASLLNTK